MSSRPKNLLLRHPIYFPRLIPPIDLASPMRPTLPIPSPIQAGRHPPAKLRWVQVIHPASMKEMSTTFNHPETYKDKVIHEEESAHHFEETAEMLVD